MYEITRETQYSNATELSLRFIQAHMYDEDVIVDTFDVSSCKSDEPVGAPVTYNSGNVIEALSVWANISNNNQWRDALSTLISSVHTAVYVGMYFSGRTLVNNTVLSPKWTGSDGVNFERECFVNSLNNIFLTPSAQKMTQEVIKTQLLLLAV